jgi:DNA polymerase-3 subunit epsilon
MSSANIETDAAIRLLAENPNFRVLERIPDAATINRELNDDLVTGIALDVETTGLDADIDDVIELGMIKFAFTRSGHIGRVLEKFKSLNQPSNPIPREISELTGIQDSDVEGRRIDVAKVERFCDGD